MYLSTAVRNLWFSLTDRFKYLSITSNLSHPTKGWLILFWGGGGGGLGKYEKKILYGKSREKSCTASQSKGKYETISKKFLPSLKTEKNSCSEKLPNPHAPKK